MQRSAWRPTGIRPGCRFGRCRAGSGGTPAAHLRGVTPVHIEVYGFIRSAVDERGRSWRKTSRSCQVRHQLLDAHDRDERHRAACRHIRPLPSDSTTTTVPVSAMAKLAPEIATLARRNFSRRCRRAASARARGSSLRSAGAGRPALAISRPRRSGGSSRRLRWIAGTRMCDGRSCPSCTINSARSVSQAAMPSRASASFSSISWVTIDLTLTTSVGAMVMHESRPRSHWPRRRRGPNGPCHRRRSRWLPVAPAAPEAWRGRRP